MRRLCLSCDINLVTYIHVWMAAYGSTSESVWRDVYSRL